MAKDIPNKIPIVTDFNIRFLVFIKETSSTASQLNVSQLSIVIKCEFWIASGIAAYAKAPNKPGRMPKRRFPKIKTNRIEAVSKAALIVLPKI